MTLWFSNYHPGLSGRRWTDARGSERGGGFISHGGSDARVRQFAEDVKAGDLLYVKVLARGPEDRDPHVPHSGFIGAARVLADPRPRPEAELLIDGQWTLFDQVEKRGDYIHHWNGRSTVEYVAPVEWLTVLDEPVPVPDVAYRQWVVNLDTAPTGPRSAARLSALLPAQPTARSQALAPPSPLDGGQGYSDLTGAVEAAGMAAVMKQLQDDGWLVDDVSSQDGLGYDLRATRRKSSDVRLIEVKATAGPSPIIWLTRSEVQAAGAHPEEWQIAVLTRALAQQPDKLLWFSAAHALMAAEPDRYRARLDKALADERTAWIDELS